MDRGIPRKRPEINDSVGDRFSEPLKKAFPVWLHLTQRGAANLLPKGTPFELNEYSLDFEKHSNQLVDLSDKSFVIAKKAADAGDSFIFSLVIFLLALFFGSVCTKVDKHLFQAILLWVGGITLILGVIVIIQLPWSAGF